ncbi:MAG: hypothetical protein ABH803_03540 [Candidatus Micrarchaeota archaeon]
MGVIAKYPFLSEAKTHLKNNRVSFIELEQAITLVLDALNKQEKTILGSDEEEARTLVIARLLLACSANSLIRKKFAEYKAREYASNLQSDEIMLVSKDFYASIKKSGAYLIPVLEYLPYGRDLRTEKINAGVIELNETALKENLRKAIAHRLNDYSNFNTKDLPELVKQAAKDLDERIPREATIKTSFKGSVVALGCVQNALSGLHEGKRYYGAMNLAIACLKDNLQKEAAIELMKKYVENSRKSTHEFTLREAETVLTWVYNHPNIGFSCRLTLANSLGGEFCKKCVYPFKARDLLK